MEITTLDEFIGKTFETVKVSQDYEELSFLFADGTGFKFHHYQDCCEYVSIEDIDGDLNDLMGYPIIKAEEVCHTTEDEDTEEAKNFFGDSLNNCWESCTWTFYKFATIKGYVVVRWVGTSNGYYSESVSLSKI